MTRFLVLNGPNINVLGRRDPGIYGSMTLDEINQQVAQLAQSLGVEVTFYQSNVEGNLIDCIQENWGNISGIIVNPGAWGTRRMEVGRMASCASWAPLLRER